MGTQRGMERRPRGRPGDRSWRCALSVGLLLLLGAPAGCADGAGVPAVIAIPTVTQNTYYTTNVYAGVAAPAPSLDAHDPPPAASPAPDPQRPVATERDEEGAGLSSGFVTCDAFFLETLRCGRTHSGGDALRTLERSLREERDRARAVAASGAREAKEQLAATCEAALRAYDWTPCVSRM